MRRALALWAILAVAVCAKAALLGGEHSVYPVFAGGSRHWWADMPLYADYHVSEGLDGYRYSPTFAVAFTPFILLPERLGAIAWNLMSVAVLVWSLHVLVRDVLKKGTGSEPESSVILGENLAGSVPVPFFHEGVFLMLTLVGSAVGIWSGQSNAILPALIVLGLAAMLRQRWWTACVFLALPVFIKLWPMALVLLLVACWPRQLIWRLAAVCVVLALIPFLTRPPSIVAWQYREWYVGLTGPLQGRWPGYRDAWTIWEEFCRLVGWQADSPLYRHAYMAKQLLMALAVLGWCLWQQRRTAAEGIGHLLMLIFSMWAAWQLLFGPGTEQLTYGIIAPSASWAVLVSFAEQRARWLTVTAWAMLALLPAGDIEQTVLAVFPGGKALLPLGVVLFVAWLVWHEYNRIYDC